MNELIKDRAGLAKQVAVQRHQRAVRRERRRRVARPPRSHHRRNRRGRDVGRDRDDPVATLQHVLARGGVLPGVEPKVVPAHGSHRRGARVVAGRVLEAADPGVAREGDGRLDRHVDARPSGHVVQHDRQLDRVCDPREVRHEPGLRRLDIVRRDDERGVGAKELGLLGRRDRRLRADGARAHEDSHLAANLLAGRSHHLLLLSAREGRGLAGRAEDDHAVRTLRLVPAQQLSQRGDVHLARRCHRRRERHQRAGRQGHAGHHRLAASAWS
mmetsp:Transcript_51223/g.169689  ORF Transcript_51223/g.169689 Transcript_51223/m.169689 type:complete len:271 (-) Transcript_51223:178-990(-)